MQTFCGYIAIVGRPNVGKSTLLNRLLGQKISITSRKPQTTRHNILGINTQEDCQFIYVDTPGIHKTEQKAMNKMMNKSASSALRDVDAAVFVIDAGKWTDEDQLVLDKIKKASIPTIAVVNKIDKQKDKGALLPIIERLTSLHSFTHILPLSAKTGNNVEQLETLIRPLLPEHPHLFDDDQLTDRPMRFIVAELVREKVFRLCGQELPYSVTVDIEQFKLEKEMYRISALILVEKEGHKRIIIGNKGEKLKAIGSAARIDMEKMLEKKVFLQCWVKVKSGWSDDERVLRNLGYDH